MAPPLSQYERELIINLRNTGCRVSDIWRQTGITRQSIYFWLRRWKREGRIQARHRTLYERSTTAEEDAAIIAMHCSDPSLSTRVTSNTYKISMDTVRRRLKEAVRKQSKQGSKAKSDEAIPEVGFGVDGDIAGDMILNEAPMSPNLNEPVPSWPQIRSWVKDVPEDKELVYKLKYYLDQALKTNEDLEKRNQGLAKRLTALQKRHSIKEMVIKVYEFMKKEEQTNCAEKISDARWRTSRACGMSMERVQSIVTEKRVLGKNNKSKKGNAKVEPKKTTKKAVTRSSQKQTAKKRQKKKSEDSESSVDHSIYLPEVVIKTENDVEPTSADQCVNPGPSTSFNQFNAPFVPSKPVGMPLISSSGGRLTIDPMGGQLPAAKAQPPSTSKSLRELLTMGREVKIEHLDVKVEPTDFEEI